MLMRELFIEELAEVRGGQTIDDILDASGIWQWIQERLYTTLACGEEGSC
jgi:hypothetical protein